MAVDFSLFPYALVRLWYEVRVNSCQMYEVRVNSCQMYEVRVNSCQIEQTLIGLFFFFTSKANNAQV